MPPRSVFEQLERNTIARMQVAVLLATQKAAVAAHGKLRSAMGAAGLGRLGNAIGQGSDAQKNGRVHQRGSGWSSSGWLHMRSRSERTRGAIEAYVAGAEITPRRGKWLWIPTDDIPSRAARQRMTPELYQRAGFETKIGPLVLIKGINGRPLLVIKNASLSASGKPRSAKSRRKDGGLRKGQVAKDFIVAFIAIPRTSRRARVDLAQIMREAQASLPRLIAAELRKG